MSELVGQVLHARRGYNCTRNEFALVLRETEKTLTVVALKTQRVSGDFMSGTEIPIVPPEAELAQIAKKDMRRVQKHKPDDRGNPQFWGHDNLWSLWDGNPRYYDSD